MRADGWHIDISSYSYMRAYGLHMGSSSDLFM